MVFGKQYGLAIVRRRHSVIKSRSYATRTQGRLQQSDKCVSERENLYPLHQEGEDRFHFILKFVLSIFCCVFWRFLGLKFNKCLTV